MRHIRLLITLSATGAVALFVGSAYAGGPPIVNETDHPINETETFVSADPCTGTPAQIALVQSGVEHVTFFADGTAHATETLRGTFSFRHLDDSGNPVGGVYATGTTINTNGINGVIDPTTLEPIGRAGITDTLNGSGTRIDGRGFHFHENEHILVVGTPPSPKLEFDKAHCN